MSRFPSVNERNVAVRSHNLFMGSTTEVSVGTADNFNVTLDNPGTSGVNYRITRIVATASTGPVWLTLHENPDSNLPTTERDVIDTNRDSAQSSDATIKADSQSNALSGGDTGIEFGIQTGVTQKDGINFIVPPTGTMGVTGGGGLTGASGSLNIWWVEEPRN